MNGKSCQIGEQSRRRKYVCLLIYREAKGSKTFWIHHVISARQDACSPDNLLVHIHYVQQTCSHGNLFVPIHHKRVLIHFRVQLFCFALLCFDFFGIFSRLELS